MLPLEAEPELPFGDKVDSLAGQLTDAVSDIIDPTGWAGFIRFNQLQKPFNNEKIRQAVMMAVNQADFLRIATGDDAASSTICKSVFPCATPLGRPTAGADAKCRHSLSGMA